MTLYEQVVKRTKTADLISTRDELTASINALPETAVIDRKRLTEQLAIIQAELDFRDNI